MSYSSLSADSLEHEYEITTRCFVLMICGSMAVVCFASNLLDFLCKSFGVGLSLLSPYRCVELYIIGTRVGMRFVDNMEDFDNMNKLAWGKTFGSILLGHLRKNHANPRTLPGCTVALVYWACEHTTMLTREQPHIYPRCAN